ncbi:MAG TPA: oxidoreductase [Patescibacteria group bacterium]|nr:oxidoreductase [Patescibacteria group bacterium]
MELVKLIDAWLNKITTYRLLAYGLALLLVVAMAFSLVGSLPMSAIGIAAMLLVLLIVCFAANRLLATLSGSPANSESWLITALILCCILPPSTDLHRLALIGLAGLIAMLSKYVLVYRHKHFFNPAAFAALILGLTGLLPAIWWIGNPAMLTLTTALGLLVLRKTRRFQLFLWFLAASLVVGTVVSSVHHQALVHALVTVVKSWPLVFLGTIMLTEPEAIPSMKWQQRTYAMLVGVIFTSQVRFGVVSATPELALIVANIYTFIVSPRYALRLYLQKKQQLAPRIYEFSFKSDRVIKFKPGQYMQWTLSGVPFDSRGNRRSFSLASAPDQHEVSIAIKTVNPGSAFKKTILALQDGDTIVAAQLAGNFVLPKNTTKPIVCIAGGIGVTPFVSMARDMVKRKEQRDIVLFYLVADPAELCFAEVWQQAAIFGFRLVPVLTAAAKAPRGWEGSVGPLTVAMLKQEVSDFSVRRYYLSGPSNFVEYYNSLLHQLPIRQSNIMTDHFSGY